jgi:RNA recognition motif-containing protein
MGSARKEKRSRTTSKRRSLSGGDGDEVMKTTPVTTSKIPANYVCKICKNDPKCGDAHWIYKCPNKVDKVTKKPAQAEKAPDTKKLFISGLPFGIENAAVEEFFAATLLSKKEKAKKGSSVVKCKTLRFDKSDRTDKAGRSNGLAFLVFATDALAEKALKLNGNKWPKTEDEPEERVFSIVRAKPKEGAADQQSKKRKTAPVESKKAVAPPTPTRSAKVATKSPNTKSPKRSKRKATE